MRGMAARSSLEGSQLTVTEKINRDWSYSHYCSPPCPTRDYTLFLTTVGDCVLLQVGLNLRGFRPHPALSEVV